MLHGKTGTARLAAIDRRTVVPVGLWGTEKVWPRSARVPDFTLVRNPPKVDGAGGQAGAAVAHRRQGGHRDDHAGDQRRCCPAEARVRHEPTPEELARTKPPR